VHDAAVVHVLDASQQHLHQISSLLLAIMGLLHNTVEELAPVDLLQHKVEVVFLLEKVKTSYDVWVVQTLQQGHLAADALLGLGVDVLPGHDFDRHGGIVHLANSSSHFCESSFAQHLADGVPRCHIVRELGLGHGQGSGRAGTEGWGGDGDRYGDGGAERD
jgi:hypothetical protein